MDLRTVVVDDEQLAREELCFQLERVGGVDVVGQAGNGVEALRVIEDHEPDLVLLDVQMPGLTGFEVARRLVDKRVGAQIVFVTAFDQYALEAFEVNAVDYLLKPVEPKRLEQAIDKVRRRVTTERPGAGPLGPLGKEELERLIQLVADRAGRAERIAQLAVKVGERFLLIATDEIVHVSVEDDAITVVTGAVSGTSNYRTLDELQGHLDPDVFWRVHRSHLVNIHKIKEIVPWFSRNYILKMKDAKGSEIPVSRAQTRRLREYLRL
jgi:two-component system LytT family response regulator/two-component system response regulator LytT